MDKPDTELLLLREFYDAWIQLQTEMERSQIIKAVN